MGDELRVVDFGKDRIPKHVSSGFRHSCVILVSSSSRDRLFSLRKVREVMAVQFFLLL
jgi:hypothetical protein